MEAEGRKNLPVQVKFSPEMKEKLGLKAKAANLNVSEYIRVSALSNEKVIFLNESGSIAKSLAELSLNLDRALRGREITTELEDKMMEKFHDVYDAFYELLETKKKINDIEGILEE